MMDRPPAANLLTQLVASAGRRAPEADWLPPASGVGDLAESGYLGTASAYVVRNSKIVTHVAGTPFETTVYKLGDKYFAVRSNEFGYANYEMISPPNNLLNIGKEVKVPPEADRATPQ